MRRKCEICGKEFESEGHELGEWLSMCHECNRRRSKLKVKPDVNTSLKKLRKMMS